METRQLILYQGAGKRPRQCCHPKGGNRAEGPKGPRTKGTATQGPEGPESGQNMRVRGPEDEQSSVPVSVLASATICFSQLSSKSRNSWAVLKALMSAKNYKNCSEPLCLRYKQRVKKLCQFIDHVKSYATLKFRKNEVFVSKMLRHPDPSLSPDPRLFFTLL